MTIQSLVLFLIIGLVAGWLADQASPPGHVVATDINTRHIPADTGYDVVPRVLRTAFVDEWRARPGDVAAHADELRASIQTLREEVTRAPTS